MTLSEFFTAVQAALPARRGNLYEQYLEREGADGQMRRRRGHAICRALKPEYGMPRSARTWRRGRVSGCRPPFIPDASSSSACRWI